MLSRAAVLAARRVQPTQQRRTFVDWMTKYPDTVRRNKASVGKRMIGTRTAWAWHLLTVIATSSLRSFIFSHLIFVDCGTKEASPSHRPQGLYLAKVAFRSVRDRRWSCASRPWSEPDHSRLLASCYRQGKIGLSLVREVRNSPLTVFHSISFFRLFVF